MIASLAPTACECACAIEQTITTPGIAVTGNRLANCCAVVTFIAFNLRIF